MKKIEISDYIILTIKDEVTHELEEWEYDYNNDPLYMLEDVEGAWNQTECPHCKTEGKLKFLHKVETSNYDHDVEWNEKANEYQCTACKKYICYTQRRKVYYRSAYYTLEGSPFGPEKTNLKKKDWRKPKIPKWDGNTCKYCGHTGLQQRESDGVVAPTGSYSLSATYFCPECKMFFYADEHDD